MNNFYELLKTDRAYRQLEEALVKGDTPQLVVGLSAVHKAHFIYSITQNTQTPALVIVPNESMAMRACEDINNMLGYIGAEYFPVREMLFHHIEGISLEYEHARLGVLGRILSENPPPVIVASAEAAGLYTMPPEKLKNYTRTLVSGKSYKLDELVEFLVSAGYTREAQVDGVAQFAVRGGILDIFPASSKEPYRIEFWGDEIDSISTFELFSQRREDNIDSVSIMPAREVLIESPQKFIKTLLKASENLKGKYGKLAKENIEKDIIKLENGTALNSADRYIPLIYPENSSLYSYCEDRFIFVCEPVSIKENQIAVEAQRGEDIKVLLEEGVLFSGCDTFSVDFAGLKQIVAKKPAALMDTFTRSLPEVKLAGMVSTNTMQLSPWSGSYEILKEDLEVFIKENYTVVIYGGTSRSCAALLSDLLSDYYNAKIADGKNDFAKGGITILEGSISYGMKYPEIGLAVIAHTKITDSSKKPKRRHKEGKRLRQISDLSVGDYVVHASHGIGVFQGVVKREIQGVTKDYIHIRYAGTDALFVPVTQLDLVSKYIGAGEDKSVKLNRLNSMEWQKTRSRVKGAVKEMAKELIAIYSKRMNTPGFAFSPDSDWQRGFEERFPYSETDDQLRSVEEIKHDMERPMPMDRLLCGDVGFGKTEVALRAVFKCVLDSKQCAVLVPTTILAWQHYQTFCARLEGYPIKVELLSRFRTPKQQKEILKELKKGEIDVIIGTHRVVQKDVEFKDLGLCIIDEEQRFGVAHKERFKELRTNVDVLTLSATPIPRTLNMAMSGIRDMSLIEDPPQDRHPVQTYVMEYQQGIIIQAIEKELRRGGQVFYLHNNTHTINRCAANLMEQLPDARIMVAHGKMGEERLSDIWRSLMEHEIDILVCTTIIETGVDVANANTLIVEDADNYGLSQLYQLRGRVGRSTRRAYAYFTFRAGKAISDVAAKRLSAIREFTTFGSGFQIAMRDLEIRGAGNILGAQQHGHMAAVGYDMYIKLLSEAVSEEHGETSQNSTECMIDIRLDAYIPESYISNNNQRIEAYKHIAGIESVDDSLDVTDELLDRYGEPPKAVMGLIEVALVRGSAAKFGISEIKQNDQKILFYPEHIDVEFAGSFAAAMKGKALINAGDKPYYSVQIEKGKGPLETIKETLKIMGNMNKQEDVSGGTPETI